MTATRARLPRTVRLLIAAAVAAVVLLAGAASAMADSAQLTVTDTAGHSDPVADVARIFTVSGATAISERVYLKYRDAGGARAGPPPTPTPGRISASPLVAR